MEKYARLRSRLLACGAFAEADFCVPDAASDDAILRAQLASWDKTVAKKSAENPLFKKVLDSQRQFAERAGQWQNDYSVDLKMAYNHYFSGKKS